MSQFGGDFDGFRQDGTVLSGYLGADYRFAPNALAGLAASYSSLDLTSTSEVEGKATLTGSLVNVYRYGLGMPEEWLGIWGIPGRRPVVVAPGTVDVTVGYSLDSLELEAFGRHVTGSGDTGYRFGFGGSLEY